MKTKQPAQKAIEPKPPRQKRATGHSKAVTPICADSVLPLPKMTHKQKLFVAEYLVDLNATQAAIRAGYSKTSAYATAAENMTKPVIAAAIQAAMDERSQRTEITQDMVLKELALLGFQNTKNLYDETGRLIPIHNLSDDIAKTISSIEVVTKKNEENDIEHLTKLRLWDKKGSLELLGRHLKMFTDKTELTGENGGPIKTTFEVTFSAGVSQFATQQDDQG